MPLKNFHKIVEETPEDVDIFVEHSMDVLDRIHELIDQKFEGRQKLLAEKLGKSEAEVSKWLNGVQNFTLRTISKLEAAFGKRIIAVCTDEPSRHFTFVKTGPFKGEIKMAFEPKGEREEHFERVGSYPSSVDVSKLMKVGS
jgi:hypothetical protein